MRDLLHHIYKDQKRTSENQPGVEWHPKFSDIKGNEQPCPHGADDNRQDGGDDTDDSGSDN